MMSSPPTDKIRIALVDDHQVVRKALCKMLCDLPNIEVVFDAADGKRFLQDLERHPVDVVLLDLEMPVMNGWQTIKALQLLAQRPKIIVLSMHADLSIAAEMLQAGANAYLLKECSIDEMQQAIEAVHAYGAFDNILSEKVKDLQNSVSNRFTPNAPFELDERQAKLLQLICDGFTSKQIGEFMSTSKKNVDRLRTQLMKKFEVSTGNELIRVAILYGLYKPRSNQQITTERQIQEQEATKRRLARLVEGEE
jgi:DNA-binding NarL/FixJ family response regulator